MDLSYLLTRSRNFFHLVVEDGVGGLPFLKIQGDSMKFSHLFFRMWE